MYLLDVNVEFHYYSGYFLALQAGFSEEDAAVLSYSAQYLDDALVRYDVSTPSGTHQTIPTHHFGFWDKGQEWDVWIPFHFFPAGPEAKRPARWDAAENPLDVQPNSAPAKAMLVRALKTRDLYRVGIALHTYADTWAHQNFSGRNEAWNRLDQRSPLPPIGHAQARRDPDSYSSSWKDPRLALDRETVSNKERFLECAGRIYRYLATFNRRSFEDEELVVDRLSELLGPQSRGREERVNEFVIECGMEPYSRLTWRREAFEPRGGWSALQSELDLESTVDKIAWLKDELLHRTNVVRREPVTGKEGFYSSHLYRWDQAARAHRSEALEQLRDLR